MLIVMCGPPGVGKSTIAAALADELDLEVIATDVIRRRMYPVILDRLRLRALDPDRPETWSLVNVQASIGGGDDSRWRTVIAEQKAAVYERLFSLADDSMARARGVILDANFPRRELRTAARSVAGRHGMIDVLVQVTGCPRAMEDRVRRRHGSDSREAAPSAAARLRSWFEHPAGESRIVVDVDLCALWCVGNPCPPGVCAALSRWLRRETSGAG